MALRPLVLFCLLTVGRAFAADELVVIGHNSLAKTDRATLQRIYTGRAVSINQTVVTPLNLPVGSVARDEFLQWVMGQNEEQYTGYWLVRRYVGKGSPPKELPSEEEVAKYVVSTPWAIGYVPLSKVPNGVTVILRK